MGVVAAYISPTWREGAGWAVVAVQVVAEQELQPRVVDCPGAFCSLWGCYGGLWAYGASPAGSGRNRQGGHYVGRQGAQGGALRAWTPASRPGQAGFPVAASWSAAGLLPSA